MTTTLYNGYTHTQLKETFDAVCDPQDWKAEIAVAVPGELVNVTVEAIKFFTATVPEVKLDIANMRYLITSVGYRYGPAGDN